MKLRYFSLVLALFSLVSVANPLCSDREALQPACDHPEIFLSNLLKVINANRHLPVSGVLAGLKLPKGTVVGAELSHSLQRSTHFDNPRLYFLTECGPLTVNLYAQTIELAIVKLVSTAPVAGDGTQSKKAGELLIDFSQFPQTRVYTAAEIVNHLDARFPSALVGQDPRFRVTDTGKKVAHDSHACSTCHVDTSKPNPTFMSLGQMHLKFEETELEGIVSPYERTPGRASDEPTYCVKADLQALYDCKCRKEAESPTRQVCKPFLENRELPKRSAAANAEACARLKVALDLAPTPHCDFHPKRCLVDSVD